MMNRDFEDYDDEYRLDYQRQIRREQRRRKLMDEKRA